MKRETCLEGPCAQSFGVLAVAAGTVLGASVHGDASRAQQPTFADFPYVIYCEYEGIAHAYYFSQLGPEGSAIYLTPDRQAGAITVDGVAQRVGGDRPGTCGDKTLDGLRASGQAFDLVR